VLEATSDEPVAGARLELEPLDEEPGRFRFRGDAESDDRGAFFIGAVGEGRWRLRAQKPGYAPAELTLDVAGEPVQGLELRLQPTQGVTLLVGRTLGSPPEQVYAAVVDGAGGVVTWGVYPTGEGGAVRLSTVPAGTWEVLVRADGTAVARVAAASPGPPVPAALAPQATLEVVVPELFEAEVLATLTMQGPDGRPHLFYGWANDVRGEQPMARGRTVLQGLPAGAWTVEVTAPDGRRWRGAATTAAGAAARVELR
jgi:predicted secreted protein